MKQKLKTWLFGLLGKDPEAVVLTFASGDPERVRAMREEVRQLIPDRQHIPIEPKSGTPWEIYQQLRRELRTRRIGAAAVLFDDEPCENLRLAAFLLAPTKVLAYNQQGERHHLQPSTPISSYLFWKGVPLDRIHLRPRWLMPWRSDRSIFSTEYRAIEGRALDASRPKVGIVTPYSPFPLSHGGAVRMYNLLREAAREFDLHLVTFGNDRAFEEAAPLKEFCASVTFFPMPRYREPRWSSVIPPEAAEFCAKPLRDAIAKLLREKHADLTQIEYTQLAAMRGDILVEHDITFDLYQQIRERKPGRSASFNLWRWKRFELDAAKRFRRVVTMSVKDANLLPGAKTVVIPNGVDTKRFTPQPEPQDPVLLFVGSFAHFPNIEAYRFFTGRVWPLLNATVPNIRLVVVAGRDPLLHWSRFTNTPAPPRDQRIELHHFVSDVRPLYHACRIALAPTTVSAGTNLKVLEAMAMGRVVVSTTSGCAGLGLEHQRTVWIADDPEAMAEGIRALLANDSQRQAIASAARKFVEDRYDWSALGRRQQQLWRELLEEKR